MNSTYSRFTLLAAAVGGLVASGFPAAEGEETTRVRQATQQTDRDRQGMEQQGDTARSTRTESQRDAMDAQEQVNEALNVVNQKPIPPDQAPQLIQPVEPQVRNIRRILSGAPGGAWGQGMLNGDDEYTAGSDFDTPNWVLDDHGWYDQDFDWQTNDPGYETWNDTDLSAWKGDEAKRGPQAQTTEPKKKAASTPLPPAPQSQKEDRERIERTPSVVVGNVVDMRTVSINGERSAQHRLIKVELSGGTTAVLDVGAASKANNALEGVKQGDRIIAIGRTGRINDRPVLVAHSVGELHSTGMTELRIAIKGDPST